MGHSPTPAGASTEATLADSIHGSLIILTVNPLVVLILVVVSLMRGGPLLADMDITGGLTET